MNTAVVETEEEDNTSNVAAGVRAAALGQNDGVWGRRRHEARMDGLREAWHPSTRMQAARAGEGRRTGARGEGRRTGGARTRERSWRRGRKDASSRTVEPRPHGVPILTFWTGGN